MRGGDAASPQHHPGEPAAPRPNGVSFWGRKVSGEGGGGGCFVCNAVVFGCCSLCLAGLTAPAQLFPARGARRAGGLFYINQGTLPTKMHSGDCAGLISPFPLGKAASPLFREQQRELAAFVPTRERNETGRSKKGPWLHHLKGVGGSPSLHQLWAQLSVSFLFRSRRLVRRNLLEKL